MIYKKIVLLLLMSILVQCEFQPRSSNAQSNNGKSGYNEALIISNLNGDPVPGGFVEVSFYEHEGIQYKIFTAERGNRVDISVINHTEEKLKVNNLKLKNKLLKKKLKN